MLEPLPTLPGVDSGPHSKPPLIAGECPWLIGPEKDRIEHSLALNQNQTPPQAEGDLAGCNISPCSDPSTGVGKTRMKCNETPWDTFAAKMGVFPMEAAMITYV